MQAIALTYEGLEPVVVQDVQDLLSVSASVHSPGRVLYEGSPEDIASFTFSARSIWGSYQLFGSCTAEVEAIISAVAGVDFGLEGSFKVRCVRRGKHDFTSVDVERTVGAALFERCNVPVDLQSPKYVVLVDISGDSCLFGLDYASCALQKRDWRVKTLSCSVNACVLYGALRLAGFSCGDVLFDPFVGDGGVLIEAAQFCQGAPSAVRFVHDLQCLRFVDFSTDHDLKASTGSFVGFDPEQGHLSAVQVNAKLGGVHQLLSLSRQDVDSIDLKQDEKTVDVVVTMPRVAGVRVSAKKVSEMYERLLEQFVFVLKDAGKACVLVERPSLFRTAVADSDLTLVDEVVVSVGQLRYTLFLLKK